MGSWAVWGHTAVGADGPVTHLAHPWGFAWRGQHQLPLGRAGLGLPCASATGREGMPGSPSSWDFSPRPGGAAPAAAAAVFSCQTGR